MKQKQVEKLLDTMVKVAIDRGVSIWRSGHYLRKDMRALLNAILKDHWIIAGKES